MIGVGYAFEKFNPLLLPKIAKSREILTKFDLTAVSHPRSSILVSIESSHATYYYSLILTSAISAAIFAIFALKLKNG